MTTPRWLAALKDNLSANPRANVYQLATTCSDDHSTVKALPQVRSLIHREIISAKSSPGLPLFLTTSDVRSPKIDELLQNPIVQICWWFGGSQDQFRIAGRASVVSAASHESYEVFDPIAYPALASLTKAEIDWSEKRREVFNSMSPHMRATWCRPPPSSVMEGGYEDAKKWPTTVPKVGEAESEEDRKNQEEALRNFALILIEPTAVDWLQLGIVPNRRTKFTRAGEEWFERILVP